MDVSTVDGFLCAVLSGPNVIGSPRKDNGLVAIWWLGNDTEKSISRNFAAKWKKYEDAWNLLEK
jgi:hypothetical protein